jgi:hypothetical protein
MNEQYQSQSAIIILKNLVYDSRFPIVRQEITIENRKESSKKQVQFF